VDRFVKDDPRLTDKVCQEVADLIYDADSQDDDRTSVVAADTFLGSMPARLCKRPRPKKRSRR
jgi:hypothetical protein